MPDSAYDQLTFSYNGGETCSSGDGNYGLTLTFNCLPDGLEGDSLLIDSINSDDPCNTVIAISHKHACPVFSARSTIEILLEYDVILCLTLVVFGLIVNFYGRKFFFWTVGLLGFVVGFFTGFSLFTVYNMLEAVSAQPVNTISFFAGQYIVALMTGLFLGFILTQMLRLAAAIMGAVCGGLLAQLVYNLIFPEEQDLWVVIAFSVVFVLLLGFLSFQYYDEIVILCTALVGSFSIVRGISLVAGYYPKEFTLFGDPDNTVTVSDLPW